MPTAVGDKNNQQCDIGGQIRFQHRGETRSGRIVGSEDASCRRGYTGGRLFVVQVPGEDGWREVYERDVLGVVPPSDAADTSVGDVETDSR